MKIQNLLSLLILVFFTSACGSQEEFVLQKGELMGPLHEANVGKITFMNGYIPYDEYSEKNFLQTFDLNESSNLNIRTFLGKTLSWYLHELAPDLSVNELCEKGNYQFTFYVDEKKIYEENLNTGAGSPSFKNSMTVFSVPLASTEEEDSWGRYLWMRFYERGGGREAINEEGIHNLKIELRPYVDIGELKVGKVIAEGSLKVNIVKIKATESQILVQAIAPDSGWPLSEETFDTEKIKALNKKIIQKDFREIRSIVVIKNGALLLEEYFNDASRSTLHDTRSVGKTFASTMMGIAIEEGHIKDKNQTLDQIYDLKAFKNYTPQKDKVTLQSLLTMSSGFDGNDSDRDSPGNEGLMYPSENWVEFALNVPYDAQKKVGSDWAYFTAGVVVLGDVLHQKVPDGLEKYTHQKLFSPLGIERYQWQYTPQQVVNTAGGLQLSALDLAKYGQVYKNGGRWGDQQVLPEDWVTASLAQQIARGDDRGGHYGYLFWNDEFKVGDQSYEVSYCAGNGGNKVFIFKELPLVVIVTATAYGQPWAHPQVDAMMEEYILPGVLGE